MINPNVAGAPNMNTTQVTVATTVTLLVRANGARRSVLITNLGTNAVWVSSSGSVTTGTGQLVPGGVGAAVSLPYTGALYAIASTSQAVCVTEVYN